MHIVELQYSNDAAAKIVATVRKWLDSGKAQPAIRYSLLGAATVLRVDFELEGEAHLHRHSAGGRPVITESARQRGYTFAHVHCWGAVFLVDAAGDG